jgi:LysM repeat protein
VTLDTLDLIPPVTAAACPYLGTEFDDRTRCAFPTPMHRCFRPVTPVPVTEEHQVHFCLTDDYPACALFQNPPAVPVHQSRDFLRRLRLPAAALAGVIVIGSAALAARSLVTNTTQAPERGAAMAPALPPGHQTYTVRPGDTLRSVSDFFGAHPDDVSALNHLTPSGALVPGTTLILPPQAPPKP